MQAKEIVLTFMLFFCAYDIFGCFFVSALLHIIADLKNNSDFEKTFFDKAENLFYKIFLGFTLVCSGSAIVFFTVRLIRFLNILR